MHNESSMKTVTTLSMFGAAIILALLCGTPALADTLLVDDDKTECPDAGFSQIQNAVNQAAPGDIIEVCPGVYDEQVKIAKPLSLVGVRRDGKKAAVVRPSNMTANTTAISRFFGGHIPLAVAILVKGTSDVTIKNIIVDGADNGIGGCEPPLLGIYYRNASGLIASATVRNIKLGPGLEDCPTGLGIYADSNAEGSSRLTVMNSSIHDTQLNGIAAMEPGTNLRAISNVITGLGPESRRIHPGIALGFDARGLIEDNSIINHVFAGCTSISDCVFPSIGILVFFTEDVSIVRNVVGKSQVGIFVLLANGVSVLENRVFDTDVFDGIAVIGDNNTVKDNIITNSDEAGVFVEGANNTIQDNTINEAPVGLLVTAGNNLLGNRLFNTPVTKEVFDPGAAAGSTQGSRRPAVIAPSVLRAGLPR